MKVKIEIEIDSEKERVKMCQILDAIKDDPIAYAVQSDPMQEAPDFDPAADVQAIGRALYRQSPDAPQYQEFADVKPEPPANDYLSDLADLGSRIAPPVSVPPAQDSGPKPETTAAPPATEAPTKKRRTRAEVEADDDKVCREVIEAAFKAYREPTPNDLPSDVRRRVGTNYVSWTDPQWVTALRAELWPVATEAPAVAAAKEAPPAEASTDFSDLLPAADPVTEAQMRFEISDKIFKIAALDKAAASDLVRKYGPRVPEYPREYLRTILAAVEAVLDEAKR